MQNGRLGMVKELQDLPLRRAHIATTLDGNPDFVKLAEAYGIPGPAGGLQRGGQGLRRRDAADKGPLPAVLHRGSQYPEHLISAFWPSEPMAKLRGQKGARFMKYTLSVLVENQPGVLSKVAGLFARPRLQYRQPRRRCDGEPRHIAHNHCVQRR